MLLKHLLQQNSEVGQNLLEGREQLAAEKFADALESIPLTLSENAGMDPIDTLTLLRSKQQKGEKWTGIDVMKGKIGNMKSSDIIEPLAVKLQIVSAAAEAACMILRIDDVIATQNLAGWSTWRRRRNATWNATWNGWNGRNATWNGWNA